MPPGVKAVSPQEVRDLLEDAYHRFATPAFIVDDPVQVPRAFALQEDAEVIGFLTATIAWGQRNTIIRNAWRMAELMDRAPHEFTMHASASELKRTSTFVHRTFNGADLRCFILALRHLYRKHERLEAAFLPENPSIQPPPMAEMIGTFRMRFFQPAHPARTEKHVANPVLGSNAKRINMFLRWMVRPADRGVDLGLWKRIPPSALYVPLDVHTGRVARELGLLHRKQDDWKSVEELTLALRSFDPADPVKYDIALFGLGVSAGK